MDALGMKNGSGINVVFTDRPRVRYPTDRSTMEIGLRVLV
jgi:hypothetical protein